MSDPDQILIFDRALLRQRRQRAAAGFARHDALFVETGEILLDRLQDIKREFRSVLVLGSRGGLAAKLARALGPEALIVEADLAPLPGGINGSPIHAVAMDEEYLPFAGHSFDLIIGNLTMHWVNDLPGALAQINACLKPDGLFLAALIGGHSLHELRVAMLEAETAIAGGISPRLSPTISLPTASSLLQRAGFLLPVTDQEMLTFVYPDPFVLMKELRGMGEANAHRGRLRKFSRRALFTEAARLYHEKFADADGGIPASFDIVFLHGWKNALATTHA